LRIAALMNASRHTAGTVTANKSRTTGETSLFQPTRMTVLRCLFKMVLAIALSIAAMENRPNGDLCG
jgi:hypothetical protein